MIYKAIIVPSECMPNNQRVSPGGIGCDRAGVRFSDASDRPRDDVAHGSEHAAEHQQPGDFRHTVRGHLGFASMLKDAVRRRFDVAMVWAVDRLGRSLPDLIGSMQEPPGIRVTYHGGSIGLSVCRDIESGETK
jgi:hypothetical protein